MKTTGFLISFVGIQFLVMEPSFASSRCLAGPIINNRAEIQIDDRLVTLIGWTHLDDTSGDALVNGLKAAVAASDIGRCEEATQIATSTLLAVSSDLKSAQDVFNAEISAQLRAPLVSIGLEMTPIELNDQLGINPRLDEAFRKLYTRCSPQIKGVADQLRLMVPGPEFAFAREHSNVSLLALEDQTLKDANEKDFDGEQSDTFDYSNPALTSIAKNAIEAIKRDLMRQVPPSEREIAQAISFEPDSAARAKLEIALRFSIVRATRIISGAYRRNVAIAANILRSPGNIAVPIGFRHVHHLVGEIIRQCQARSLPVPAH